MPPEATGITLRSPRPALIEEQAVAEVLQRVRRAQRVVNTGGDVEVMAFHFAGFGAGFVHRFHHKQETIAPMHEGLRIDVFVVLAEIETALQRLIDHAAIVAAG